MIKCSKCYRYINDDNANFCPYCSYPLRGVFKNIKTFDIFKIFGNIRYALTKKTVKNKLRVVRINLIIFAILNIILEVLSGGVKSAGIRVYFQYLISKKIIMNDKIKKVNTIIQISKRCWKISLIVLFVRILLGLILLLVFLR